MLLKVNSLRARLRRTPPLVARVISLAAALGVTVLALYLSDTLHGTARIVFWAIAFALLFAIIAKAWLKSRQAWRSSVK